MNSAEKLSRQVRRRMEAKAERAARRAERVEQLTGAVTVHRGELEQLRAMLPFFIGLVKQTGRVRLEKATLEGLEPSDRVTKKEQPDGSVVLTFRTGSEPEEGGSQR